MKELIHFTAKWCVPCQRLAPIIEDFLIENKDVEYIKIDIDTDFKIAEQYDVMSIPTLISKIDGKIHDRATGLVSGFVIKSLFG